MTQASYAYKFGKALGSCVKWVESGDALTPVKVSSLESPPKKRSKEIDSVYRALDKTRLALEEQVKKISSSNEHLVSVQHKAIRNLKDKVNGVFSNLRTEKRTAAPTQSGQKEAQKAEQPDESKNSENLRKMMLLYGKLERMTQRLEETERERDHARSMLEQLKRQKGGGSPMRDSLQNNVASLADQKKALLTEIYEQNVELRKMLAAEAAPKTVFCETVEPSEAAPKTVFRETAEPSEAAPKTVFRETAEPSEAAPKTIFRDTAESSEDAKLVKTVKFTNFEAPQLEKVSAE
ncbi:MAG: hypothetical protein HQL32_09595 [Planctomycetes bacterium]|nr:hypothetical protein [Planctomycetota bacterium]